MSQTPVHEHHNPDLLRFIPSTSKNIVEIGCSSGALAREFKKMNPDCQYLGVDIDQSYTELAKRYCDKVMVLNLDDATAEFYIENRHQDAWIFGDTLEHLKDPWKVLDNIRAVISTQGSIVACIPNAQHWSLQARLSVGDFRYQESGLLDKTHLRWFTRQTIIEMFQRTGFSVVEMLPRVFDEPGREIFLPVIGAMADKAGFDSKIAVSDSMPLQYVVRATPI